MRDNDRLSGLGIGPVIELLEFRLELALWLKSRVRVWVSLSLVGARVRIHNTVNVAGSHARETVGICRSV